MLRSKFFLFFYHVYSSLLRCLFPSKKLKLKIEYFYWWLTKRKEKELGNSHYEEFYTDYFDLSVGFYESKKVLDIGCGPRGSLEWATKSDTFGLDPLIEKYKNLGLEKHKTIYVQANCEAIPFEDAYFDVVSSFNSLDHVDDLDASIQEIKRVVKQGGLFLLIADIHIEKTICEPSAFSWGILSQFEPEFEVLSESHFEGNNLYKSIRENIPFDHKDTKNRYGVLTAKLIKK
jgi:SAM-dependent methyltransferase